MLHFSDKEYDYLKREVSEIRSYITKLIGLIITVSGLSVPIIEKFVDTNEPLVELALITVAILVITSLFELVWYKFKSHNRYTGYIQLINQEVDFIAIEKAKVDKQKFKNKDYVRNYANYIYESNVDLTIYDRLRNLNLTSWEFIMSRLNSSNALKTNTSEEDDKRKLRKAIDKSMFVFQLPDKYEYSFIKDYKTLDLDFSDKITYDLYKRKSETGSKHANLIDKRYVTVGWAYPKVVTKIAFLGIIILVIGFLSVLITEFNKIVIPQAFSAFNFKEWLPVFLMVLVIATFIYWIKKFYIGLKDLSSGTNSIDGYCWRFFIFRVQLLNSRGIIPIYFSRSFVRFFKTQ